MHLATIIWSLLHFCVLTKTFSVDSTKKPNQLVAVITLSRHGDRSPLNSFPNDEFYNPAHWPMGLGQLTQTGLKRHYNLGVWLRRRYNTFLSDIYSPNDIYACSTDTDRSLMSTAVNLAGLYPPKAHQVWNDAILWQPIPVHVADFLSLIENVGCKKYFEMLAEIKSKIYSEVQEKHADFFDDIANYTGWSEVTVEEVEFLVDVFATYKENNVSFVPDWESHLDKNLTDHLAGIVYEIPTHTVALARLRIGTFYHRVFKIFDKFAELSLDKKVPAKFTMITGHENTLSAVLNTMGAFNMRHIDYADTIIMELKKKSTGDYFVNVLYKNGEELEKIEVKGCDFDCGLEEFGKKLANVTVSHKEWYEECGIGDKFVEKKDTLIKR